MINSLVLWIGLTFFAPAWATIETGLNCETIFGRTLSILEQRGMAFPVTVELQMIEDQLGPVKAESFRKSLEQTRFKFISGGYGGYALLRAITLHEFLKESPYLQLVLVHELDHVVADFVSTGRKVARTLYTVDAVFKSERSAETRVWNFIHRNYTKQDLPRLYSQHVREVERVLKPSWYSAGLLDAAGHGFIDKKRILRQASRKPDNAVTKGAAIFLFNQLFYETVRNALEMDLTTFSERTLPDYENQNAFGNLMVGLYYSTHLIAAHSLAQALGWLK